MRSQLYYLTVVGDGKNCSKIYVPFSQLYDSCDGSFDYG